MTAIPDPIALNMNLVARSCNKNMIIKKKKTNIKKKTNEDKEKNPN